MRAWGWLLVAGCAADPADTAAPDGAAPVDTGRPVAVGFGFPVPARDLIYARVGVDHDEAVQTGLLAAGICQDYLGRAFPHCYDQHDGSDFMLDGSFATMDAGSTPVVAAMDGVVVETHDGEYDRCHAYAGGISCDGHPVVGNHVKLRHADGSETWYWHLAKGSVVVAVGDEVACGQELGLVGSSGYSSAPHLHFEVHDATGATVDPYAGPYSQPESWWAEQGVDDALPGPGCTAG